MRREELYLQDIVEAAVEIAGYLEGVEQERFLANSMLRSAVLLQLMIIGEAASRLPSSLKARHPEVAWSKITSFRSLIVHAYFAMSWPIVWSAAVMDTPDLRRSIAAILVQEYPDIQIPEPPQED